MNKDSLFLHMFAESVKRFGSKTAIVDHDGARSTSYHELDVLSGRVCAALQKARVQKASIIPIVLGREMEYAAAEIGVLKAGAAFAALSAEYPAARIEYIKKDCGAPLVIDEAFMQQALQENPASCAFPEEGDAAFVIYTSGSTGNPKGILHTHRSMAEAIRRMMLCLETAAQDAVLSVAPLFFISMILDLYTAFASGMTAHILSDAARRSISGIEAYVQVHRPTLMFISPQMLKLLNLENTSLRAVLCGVMEIEKAKGFFNQIIMHEDILAAMSAAMNPDPAGKNGTV